MSEKMLEELVSDVEVGIDYNPDVHQEWCNEAHEALGNILAELRSLRAEVARLTTELAAEKAIVSQLDKDLADLWRADGGSRE